MARKPKTIIIPKDKAVFWLDKHGRWNNVHGKFQHKKIIDHFHASIKKDRDGYYLGQTTEDYTEKVYFHCEDTALFVFDIVKTEDMTQVLNTGKQIGLRPRKLLMKGDNLYMHIRAECVKFTERSLMMISDLIESVDDDYYIRVKNRRYKINKRL